MEDILRIESLQNPRVKAVVRLRKVRARRESGRTVIEGCREIARAVQSGWPLIELYCCPELYLDEETPQIVEQVRRQGSPVFQCTPAVFRKMSYRDTPDGLMALSKSVGTTLDQLLLSDHPLLLITENLEKPGNLGTILRTADAAGVEAVIVCGHKTDINNPNVIRASIGTLFYLPVAEADSAKAIEWLRGRGIRILAALPDADLPYTQADMRGPIAIVVGAEDEGLTPIWAEQCDGAVSIPMLGRNDSLNVSSAAAILLYEAVRRRSTG